MNLRWIDNYAGTWVDDEGRLLIITPRNEDSADVDLLVNGTPMLRPWCGDKPSKSLRGKLGFGPDLDIALGRPGFSMNVNYESGEFMTPDGEEYLSVGITRYESDLDAEKFVGLLGNCGSYKRHIAHTDGTRDAENGNLH